jgi:starch phosphorylase
MKVRLLNLLQMSGASEERGTALREAVKRAFLDNLFLVQGKTPALATQRDYYMALAYTVRDRMMQRWISTAEAYTRHGSRTVAYLSAEFLMGPQLGSNILSLGIDADVRAVIADLGLDLDTLLACEDEPGLGNGGLGRLAACFLDSLATLEIPSLGYGIRYEFGLFQQAIVAGRQVERTDEWLRFGNPWEIARPEWAVLVKLGGRTERYVDESGRSRVRWVPARVVAGVPYDTPILGYRVNTANTLRLWKSEAPESFDFSVFNRGDYLGAVSEKVVSENLSKVLYPNDETQQGKELRLQQQYFFVACSFSDMLRILKVQQIPLDRFHEKFAIQLNDTHPSIAVAELMRLLVDELGMAWEQAWAITTRTLAYTNHTLLPEALECWPLSVFGHVLPRHLEIIFEINARFLEEVRARFPDDPARISRMSLIDEGGERAVRMAHLACVGSHAINGVADLHTQLLKESVLRDFHELWPHKISNKTNGVTPRRWLALTNPALTRLISDAIGDGWLRDLSRLTELKRLADDAGFQRSWRQIKHNNKVGLAALVRDHAGVIIDPQAMMDVQVKRIHEYKRQHLNLLHIIALYIRLKSDSHFEMAPRTFLFSGKAAPGYHLAKLIIQLANGVADVINHDRQVNGRLRVVFVPNFSVKNGQRIYPAAELSEQISTAGKEASGTGNMKMCMNGALTIGTLDGANVEISREVGCENVFLFGLSAGEVEALRVRGYRPADYFEGDPLLEEVLKLIGDGTFSQGDAAAFKPLVDSLTGSDPFLVLADFRAYLECQARAGSLYQEPRRWNRMSILNVANSGLFSSDRTIKEYATDIWKVRRVPIRLLAREELSYGIAR